ncbi:MAG: DUF2293 domain-containing protein [Bacteroidales bacterium]|jgi:hypothetical protein
MEKLKRIVSPGPNSTLLDEEGYPVIPPTGWTFLPAGDAGVTRKVTSNGAFWRVQFKKGRRTISKGVWAPAVIIKQALNEVDTIRNTDDYKKKRQSDLNRRERKQSAYEKEFCASVEVYLNFHQRYKDLEKMMAQAITAHAVPVGSGTVARTAMIPVEERAAKAVIAWMRHQTTAYDNMQIAHIKGERRAIRRQLAQQSVALLSNYRMGEPISENCPLRKAIMQIE